MVHSCHLCKASPALATSTFLGAKNDIIVCVPFMKLNHGKKLQRRKLSRVHSLSELLTSVV